ncbi:MAG TPA: response regulator, partial [bacterium]
LERLGGGGVDLVLLDLTLSDSLGLETFDRVRAASPAVPVVLLTSIDDDAVVRAARRKGAAGFLAKHRLTLESLGRAIEAASGSGAPEPPPRMSAQA